MIAGHLTGGLGNRLFQHAAAMGLAEKFNLELVFCESLMGRTEHGPKENILKLFPKTKRVESIDPYIMIPEQHGLCYTYVEIPSVPLLNPSNNYCVDGWRQCDKYFPLKQKIDADLSGALNNSSELLKEYSLSTIGEKEKTWFIHLRAGDYSILPHHQIDIGSYYSKAFSHIPLNNSIKILLFSDDNTYLQYLKNALIQMGHTESNIKIVEKKDELESLYLMSNCWGGAIVANSTFSWWGAYFAHQACVNKSNHIALYPYVWGGITHPLPTDVVPSWGITVNF